MDIQEEPTDEELAILQEFKMKVMDLVADLPGPVMAYTAVGMIAGCVVLSAYYHLGSPREQLAEVMLRQVAKGIEVECNAGEKS